MPCAWLFKRLVVLDSGHRIAQRHSLLRLRARALFGRLAPFTNRRARARPLSFNQCPVERGTALLRFRIYIYISGAEHWPAQLAPLFLELLG